MHKTAYIQLIIIETPYYLACFYTLAESETILARSLQRKQVGMRWIGPIYHLAAIQHAYIHILAIGRIG